MFIFLPLVCPRWVDPSQCRSEKGEESSGRKAFCPDPGSRGRRVWKNLANLSNQFAASANRRFQFHKRSQLFIGVHNETLSVVAMRPNSTGLAQICGRSIVSFDRPFDNLGFLGDKLRQMLLYVVRSQAHRLISTGFVLKDADGRALALTSIEPIVAHKPLRLLDDGHEVLTYPAVDLCTVLRIKVIVANDGEHNTSPYL